MTSKIITELRNDLKQSVDRKAKAGMQYFFKEKVIGYGVKTADVNRLAKEYWQRIKDVDKKEIFLFCEELFLSGYNEEAWIAADWVYRLKNSFAPVDFPVLRRWIEKYIDNWAKCDTFCNHAVGAFVEQFPQFITELKKWTQSPNRWLKRAAAVTLILPARRGKFLKDVFAIADKLMLDPDDMVQKGYGWLLKEASKAHQKTVFDYVMKNKAVMPRTALRYAIEKMPANLKKQAMAKEVRKK